MISTRVLIVEPDHPFGLSLASLFQDDGAATRVAGSAAEAEMEIATRRPDLLVVRAELPDLSGFSLCARLRHHPATAPLPIILYSSDTAPASLAEHARTPWAANGYLAMPVDATALRTLARRILASAAAVESADDSIIDESEPTSPAPRPPPVPRAEPREGAPPPVPRKAVRSALDDADRIFVDRTFQSIADRRDALLAEAQRNRPPPRRDLLHTADGRLQLLRDDLKAREAQIARLAEIWEIREREVSYAGEWLHEKDVELQGLKGQVQDLSGRLAEARELTATKVREHGAEIDAMLLERAAEEKELIELIAQGERALHDSEQRHEAAWRAMEERLAAVDAERRDLVDRVASLEAALATERTRAAAIEAELAEVRRAMGESVAALDAELAAERARATAIEAELAEVRRAAGERVAALDAELAAERARAAAIEGELAEVRRTLEGRVATASAELAAERARAEALEAELAEVRRTAEAAGADAARQAEELRADVEERDRVLAAAKRENDRLQAELTAARHEYMVSESEAQVARDRAERADELASHLEHALRERDEARAALAQPSPQPGDAPLASAGGASGPGEASEPGDAAGSGAPEEPSGDTPAPGAGGAA